MRRCGWGYDRAWRKLSAELDEGRRSGEENGWVTAEEVRARFDSLVNTPENAAITNRIARDAAINRTYMTLSPILKPRLRTPVRNRAILQIIIVRA